MSDEEEVKKKVSYSNKATDVNRYKIEKLMKNPVCICSLWFLKQNIVFCQCSYIIAHYQTERKETRPI